MCDVETLLRRIGSTAETAASTLRVFQDTEKKKRVPEADRTATLTNNCMGRYAGALVKDALSSPQMSDIVSNFRQRGLKVAVEISVYGALKATDFVDGFNAGCLSLSNMLCELHVTVETA